MTAKASLFATRHANAQPTPAGVLDLPALVGAAAWSRLPAAVQRRFGAAQHDRTYQGHMDLRCSGVGRLYALLARALGGPLTPYNANAVATTVRVWHNGSGGVVWDRVFHGGAHGAAHTVRSTKELDATGRLQERTVGGLSMALDVFEQGGALVFRSRRYDLIWPLGRLGRLRIPVPTWMTPGVCRVEHVDLGQGQFRFTLRMVHALWGQTFYQSGVFQDPVSMTHQGAV